MSQMLVGTLIAFFLISNAVAGEGIIELKSSYSVTETLDRFEQAASEKGMTIFARIDHAKGAEQVGKGHSR